MAKYLILLLLFSPSVFAEKYECASQYGDSSIIADDEGRISFANKNYAALYQVKGFDKRWDFGKGGNVYPYAFIIGPDGQGYYFEFNSKGTNGYKYSFTCKSA